MIVFKDHSIRRLFRSNALRWCENLDGAGSRKRCRKQLVPRQEVQNNVGALSYNRIYARVNVRRKDEENILFELHIVAFVFELLVDRRPLAAEDEEAEEQPLFVRPVERLVERVS